MNMQDKRLKYTKKLADEILDHISISSQPIKTIVKIHGINTDTWYRWIKEVDGLADKMRRARENRARISYDIGLDRLCREMDEYIDTTNDDYVLQKSKLQAFRIKISVMQYKIERGNQSEFGPKPLINQSVTIHAGDAIDTAWSHRRKLIGHSAVQANYRIADKTGGSDSPQGNDIQQDT